VELVGINPILDRMVHASRVWPDSIRALRDNPSVLTALLARMKKRLGQHGAPTASQVVMLVMLLLSDATPVASPPTRLVGHLRALIVVLVFINQQTCLLLVSLAKQERHKRMPR